VDSTTDPEFRFSALERWVMRVLAVPSAPEPPDGSPESIRFFRAGANNYNWCVLVWAMATAAVLAGLAAQTLIAAVTFVPKLPGWGRAIWLFVEMVAWSVFAVASTVTFLSRRLNYRLRWYIVTDRSLRIRSGVFAVNELTMTYGNIQEIRVSSGPLQHVLGLADVEVQAAGGGGDNHDSGHVGRFEGLSNATAVRDLIADRVRQYRDSGLGDTLQTTVVSHAHDAEIAAAALMLEEARALRASLVHVESDGTVGSGLAGD
jgi:membrane protein YdbS with pleckstrin-like domain